MDFPNLIVFFHSQQEKGPQKMEMAALSIMVTEGLFTLAQPFDQASYKPGMMVHTCNTSTLEAEAGGSPVCGQTGLHVPTLCLSTL